MRKTMIYALTILIILTGCSTESKEIERQEEIINEFLEIYFDESHYGTFGCATMTEERSECVVDELYYLYSDYLDEDIISSIIIIPFNRYIASSYFTGGLKNMEITYELLAPETLEFPNVFQVLVKHVDEGVEYYINIKVEDDLITQFTHHRK